MNQSWTTIKDLVWWHFKYIVLPLVAVFLLMWLVSCATVPKQTIGCGCRVGCGCPDYKKIYEGISPHPMIPQHTKPSLM